MRLKDLRWLGTLIFTQNLVHIVKLFTFLTPITIDHLGFRHSDSTLSMPALNRLDSLLFGTSFFAAGIRIDARRPKVKTTTKSSEFLTVVCELLGFLAGHAGFVGKAEFLRCFGHGKMIVGVSSGWVCE
jgi:hypothetical protein